MEEAAEDPERRAALAAALRRHPGGLLPWQDIVQYSEIDPANARLRGLLADTVDRGAWQLLWIPSALSYYRTSGPYASEALRGLTKRLVFSSWRVVPRVIASLLSYAAERRMIRSLEDSPENTPDARRRRTALLRFTRADMRLTGMPVLGIMYPCSTLARICDPLGLLGEGDGEDGPTVETTLERAQRKIEPLLSELEVTAPGPGAQADETWYWAAPILLDLRHGGEAARTWLGDPGIAARWAGEVDREDVEEASVWNEHVELARKLLSRSPRLGPKPPDLALVLAQMSLGAPGIVALRGLARVSVVTTRCRSLDCAIPLLR